MKFMKETYLKRGEIEKKNDYLCQDGQYGWVSREYVERCPKFPRLFPYIWHFFNQR